MPTREQLHQDVDAVPDDQLDSAQVVVLDSAGDQLGSNGNSASGNDDDQTVDEARVRTLQEVSASFAGVDFLPREDAWA